MLAMHSWLVVEEMGEDLRFEEGVHLLRPVDLHMSNIWILSRELDGKVLERIVLRHDEGVWGELQAVVDELVDGRWIKLLFALGQSIAAVGNKTIPEDV